MKKTFYITFLIFILSFFSNIVYAQSSSDLYTEGWEVSSFNAKINIEKNGDIFVSENIITDFTNEAHKGLARIIPLNNRKIEFISATDQSGISWSNNVYEGYKNELNIEMRTQDLSEMTKKANFNVDYKVYNVISHYQPEIADKFQTYAHDEFYWNLNGNN